ncbi:MAG: hypothetical protein V3T88_01685 [Nitrosomonadaceae bacterium]
MPPTEKNGKTPLLFERIRKLEDTVDELKLCVEYLRYDLEATKREMKDR